MNASERSNQPAWFVGHRLYTVVGSPFSPFFAGQVCADCGEGKIICGTNDREIVSIKVGEVYFCSDCYDMRVFERDHQLLPVRKPILIALQLGFLPDLRASARPADSLSADQPEEVGNVLYFPTELQLDILRTA